MFILSLPDDFAKSMDGFLLTVLYEKSDKGRPIQHSLNATAVSRQQHSAQSTPGPMSPPPPTFGIVSNRVATAL